MSKQPRLDRRVANAVYRNSFGAFVYAAFKVVNPGLELEENWHIDYVCHYVEMMINVEMMITGRKPRRLVFNQPPRTLKSFIVSIALPALLLGRDPGARIIAASYSLDLASVRGSMFWADGPKMTRKRECVVARGGSKRAAFCCARGTVAGRI
jgi:hypothetical protein